MCCGGFWAEWGDSNSRHLAPKASALPTALHPDMKFSNCGQTCGQRRFLTSYRRGGKYRQPRCIKGFQGFDFFRMDEGSMLPNGPGTAGRGLPCSLPTDGSVLFYFTGFPRKVKSIPAAFFAPLEKTGRRRLPPAGSVSGHFVTQRWSSSTVSLAE